MSGRLYAAFAVLLGLLSVACFVAFAAAVYVANTNTLTGGHDPYRGLAVGAIIASAVLGFIALCLADET